MGATKFFEEIQLAHSMGKRMEKESSPGFLLRKARGLITGKGSNLTDLISEWAIRENRNSSVAFLDSRIDLSADKLVGPVSGNGPR